ncbi:MAG: polysaccharide ABC transporter ATP-binding protein [Acidimicrobiales bacterium]
MTSSAADATIELRRTQLDKAVPGSEQATPTADTPTRRLTIDVDNVSKSFTIDGEPGSTLKDRLLSWKSAPASKEFHALTDVSMQVFEGETFGILGHNGSGKSTLLKVIAGTIRPTNGRVRTRGRLSALLELGAGFHPDLTGRENIFLNGSILGIPKPKIEEIFDDIVRFAELEEFINLQVKYYSSGMQGRLGFAVATNLEPDVLLIDEVLAVGDEAFQAKCMERVHRFRQLGRTMVLVSHGTEQVRQLCNRAAVMEKGHVLYVGDTDEAIEVYRRALHGGNDRSAPAPASDGADITVESGEQLPAGEQLSKPGATTELPTDTQGQPLVLHSAQVVEPEQPTIQPGGRVVVTVNYLVDVPFAHAIRLEMTAMDGTVMMTRSSLDILEQALPGVSGGNEIRFGLDGVPLLAGQYRLTAIAESPDGHQIYGRLANFAEIRIDGPGSEFGPIHIPISCAVRPITLHSESPSDIAQRGSLTLQ